MEEKEYTACVKAEPLNVRFADEDLSHRDFLGALINLGIERDCIGDILVGENVTYIYATAAMGPFIAENLAKVKHTDVKCELVDPEECTLVPQFDEVRVNVASERVDAIVAGVYNLSRTVAARLITSEYISINGTVVKSGGKTVPVGAAVSVRNHGKFYYDGIDGTTKKSRLYIRIRKCL